MGHHGIELLRPPPGGPALGAPLPEAGEVGHGEAHVGEAELPGQGLRLRHMGRMQINAVEAGLRVGGGVEDQIEPGPETDFQPAEAPRLQLRLEIALMLPPEQQGLPQPGHRKLAMHRRQVGDIPAIVRSGGHAHRGVRGPRNAKGHATGPHRKAAS